MAWLSKGDFKTRWEGYQIGRRTGAYSVNDILRKEGENTIGPAGDIRIVESNMTRLELVGQTPQPAAPKPNEATPPDPEEADPAEEDQGDGEDMPMPMEGKRRQRSRSEERRVGKECR